MASDPKSSYYDVGGIEVIKYIKAKLTPEQFEGYLLGNVLKYSSRLSHKGDAVRDAEKLNMYSTWLKEHEAEYGSTKRNHARKVTR